MPFTSMELMICCAARELEDGKTVAVGTGLPCAAAMLAQRTHAPNLDVLTTPGYLTGPGAREAAGLPAGSGPHRVITDLCVLDFHPETKRMRVKSLHPGKTLEQVRAATGFELDACDPLTATVEPN